MLGNAGAATEAALIKDTTTKDFSADVLQESRKQPVLVDFWAPWCGPCRQLTPVLEKVVNGAKGKVKLVKMNIDDHPAVAGQLGIQSIPAVIAFVKGQPVDGFMGALPEAQVKSFIERLVGDDGGGADLEEALAHAEAALEAGDAVTAAEVFAAVLGEEPDNARAIAGLAASHLAAGDLDKAKATLEAVPADKAKDPAVAAVRARIELAERTAEMGDLVEFERRLAADPKDNQARHDLALALAARGRTEEATDHLLEIVRRDRAWNEDGARKALVQLFEAWGPTDPATIAGRRRLSSVLFS